MTLLTASTYKWIKVSRSRQEIQDTTLTRRKITMRRWIPTWPSFCTPACVSPMSQASGGGFSWSVELIDKNEQVTFMCMHVCVHACVHVCVCVCACASELSTPVTYYCREALAGSPDSLVRISRLPPLPQLVPLLLD